MKNINDLFPTKDEMYTEIESRIKLSKTDTNSLVIDDTQVGFEECYKFIKASFERKLNEYKTRDVRNAALSYAEKQANQKAAIAIRDFCKSVMHEDSDLHKDSSAWIKEHLGIDICDKTNEPCKIDCKWLCRESF